MSTVNILQGESIRLTALTQQDLGVVARWQEDATFLRLYDASPAHPKSEAALTSWLEERQKASDGFLFAIRPADGSDLLGYLELDGILWAHGTAWMSIAIGDSANWGKGYGHQALRLALAFAFGELNLRRVQLTVFSYNERAIALYQGAGFRQEGAFREFLQRDGTTYDMLLYGILRREWEQQRER